LEKQNPGRGGGSLKVEVKLPELGKDAADEATVSFFYPEVGDHVDQGDELVEMLTDKAAFNVPSPVSGKLVEIVAHDNELVKVGGTLAVIDTED
jgi:pyruvate/2-oxoglutarate dehydrogenase complex dihydrolipoamide acyltransferase (E2) component